MKLNVKASKDFVIQKNYFKTITTMSNKIKKIQAQIQSLALVKNALRIKQMKICNKANDLQHELDKADPGYKEEIEKVKNGRKTVKKRIGRIYWNEEFKDEDTGESIFVDRSRICSVDGKPCDQFGNLLEYYDLTHVK